MVPFRDYIVTAFHVHVMVALHYVHLASLCCVSRIAILYALSVSRASGVILCKRQKAEMRQQLYGFYTQKQLLPCAKKVKQQVSDSVDELPTSTPPAVLLAFAHGLDPNSYLYLGFVKTSQFQVPKSTLVIYC